MFLNIEALIPASATSSEFDMLPKIKELLYKFGGESNQLLPQIFVNKIYPEILMKEEGVTGCSIEEAE